MQVSVGIWFLFVGMLIVLGGKLIVVRKGFGNSSVKCMSNGFTRRCKGCAYRSKPIFVRVEHYL